MVIDCQCAVTTSAVRAERSHDADTRTRARLCTTAFTSRKMSRRLPPLLCPKQPRPAALRPSRDVTSNVIGDIAQARRCGVVEIDVGTRKRRRRRALLPTNCRTRRVRFLQSRYYNDEFCCGRVSEFAVVCDMSMRHDMAMRCHSGGVGGGGNGRTSVAKSLRSVI